MDSINLWNTLAITLLTVIGGIWTFFKLFYKYKTKVLFITNCQILHMKIWDAMVAELKIKTHGEEDFAYRPLVLLPHGLKEYSDVKNGQKAILESVNPNNENSLKIIAEVYWIPKDMDPWGTIKHPVFSLILRRYFGIERPMYQDEDVDDVEKNPDWMPVGHSDAHLKPLNRANKEKKEILWAVSKSYTYRFFNPYDGTYHRQTAPDNFIEYCGLSIILRKRTLAHEND
ncbi:MAG: hypothetical protein KQH67_13040 [Bacteroidetes bacterium]|nr:hypothetical protein [Bacteroidota bacterium]